MNAREDEAATEMGSRRLAVLIDADNAQAAIIEQLLAEIAKYGIATVKRIYGDFTSPALASWRDALLRHSIQPIQQFRNTTGKNATDSALIIDAMDLLHSHRFGGFCIVSSDSDFTRLASRMREEGAAVYGFGEKKTPQSFVAACDRFIYTEILRPKTRAANDKKPAAEPKQAPDGAIAGLISEIVDDCSDEDGWVSLGQIGQVLMSRQPDFDPRSYGAKKLSDLVAAIAMLEVEKRGNGPTKSVYARLRKTPRTGRKRAPAA